VNLEINMTPVLADLSWLEAEAITGPSALSMYEPSVCTHETHPKKGYGSIVSAK
jgi:hypothetical protein